MHTPGPWTVAPNLTAVLAGPDADPVIICETELTDPMSLTYGCEANATLIAAAPDLLGACKYALQRVDGKDISLNVVLRDAITKAEGEPNV